MEIIKHGNAVQQGICLSCNCEFIYNHKDIKEHYTNIPFSSHFHYEKFVQCPECGSSITIKESYYE